MVMIDGVVESTSSEAFEAEHRHVHADRRRNRVRGGRGSGSSLRRSKRRRQDDAEGERYGTKSSEGVHLDSLLTSHGRTSMENDAGADSTASPESVRPEEANGHADAHNRAARLRVDAEVLQIAETAGC
jgi:hypothetical protein